MVVQSVVAKFVEVSVSLFLPTITNPWPHVVSVKTWGEWCLLVDDFWNH